MIGGIFWCTTFAFQTPPLFSDDLVIPDWHAPPYPRRGRPTVAGRGDRKGGDDGEPPSPGPFCPLLEGIKVWEVVGGSVFQATPFVHGHPIAQCTWPLSCPVRARGRATITFPEVEADISERAAGSEIGDHPPLERLRTRPNVLPDTRLRAGLEW